MSEMQAVNLVLLLALLVSGGFLWGHRVAMDRQYKDRCRRRERAAGRTNEGEAAGPDTAGTEGTLLGRTGARGPAANSYLPVLAFLLLAAPSFGQYVTLRGTLSASNGVTASDLSVSFRPSQWFFVPGTAIVVSTVTNCATSRDGSVVGLLNPQSAPTADAQYSGTLPAATYWVTTTWTAGTGETLASPETTVQLSGPGAIVVQPPTGAPAAATGMKVYIGATSGSETLQGSVTTGSNGVPAFTLSVPLGTGTAMPVQNTTVCKQIANDAGWPTGTGYTVSLTDQQGNTQPGYPMQWQLLGPGNTIDLTSGLPYYNGVVYFPSPVLATPVNHATQSISGGLSLSGYWLTNVGRIGCGTATPAWSVDCPTINAQTGFLLGGQAPLNHILLGNGQYYVDSAKLPSSLLPTGYYQTMQSDGAAKPQRTALNLAARFALTDDSTDNSTGVDLAPSGVTAGTYQRATITVDTYGRVVSAATETSGVTASIANLTGSRSFGTLYTNGTGHVLVVSGWGLTNGSSVGNLQCETGANSSSLVAVYASSATATVDGGQLGWSCVIPANFVYELVPSGAVTSVGQWVETSLF